jgi:phosphonate transport system substrate-binding protein
MMNNDFHSTALPRRRALCTAIAGAGFLLASGWPGRASANATPLVMAIFPRRQATQTMELYKPLADYLAREIGRPVQLVTAKDFDTFWLGVTEGRYDLVHYNQFHYVRSTNKYRVIVRNEEFGTGTVAGALYVRKDAGITKVEQLRGKKIVFGGGTDAMMAYIMPTYLLMEAGLKPGDYEEVFAKNPPNSLISLYQGQADASGAGDIMIDLPVVKNAIDTSTVQHLAKTGQVVHLPWAVRKTMDPALATKIQNVLVGMKNTDEGRTLLKQAQQTGFGIATDADYDAHRKFVRRVMPAVELPR